MELAPTGWHWDEDRAQQSASIPQHPEKNSQSISFRKKSGSGSAHPACSLSQIYGVSKITLILCFLCLLNDIVYAVYMGGVWMSAWGVGSHVCSCYDTWHPVSLHSCRDIYALLYTGMVQKAVWISMKGAGMELTTLNPLFLWILEMGFLCDFGGIAFCSVLKEEYNAHLRMERSNQANRDPSSPQQDSHSLGSISTPITGS